MSGAKRRKMMPPSPPPAPREDSPEDRKNECAICFFVMYKKEPAGRNSRASGRNAGAHSPLTRAMVADVQFLSCGHFFHTACLNEWFTRLRSKDGKCILKCPSCTRPVDKRLQ